MAEDLLSLKLWWSSYNEKTKQNLEWILEWMIENITYLYLKAILVKGILHAEMNLFI